MLEYKGVAKCMCSMHDKTVQKDVLVMRNLMDGATKLRLLDLKMGEKTAEAGWKGKSAFAALRQGVVDALTNSEAEGFRLEGFDHPPKALLSMDPLLDFGGSQMFSGKALKKA